MQIRHTIHHPEHGQLRNGTAAKVARVDPRTRELDLQLTDGRHVRLTDRQIWFASELVTQIDQADLRLAYVQHPFPAQGHTTDTTHLIVAAHATREGTYVALTRAREQTHIYAQNAPEAESQIESLAERTSRSEPDLPSIQWPLAHEIGLEVASAKATSRDEATAERTPEVAHPDPEVRRWPRSIDDETPEEGREAEQSTGFEV